MNFTSNFIGKHNLPEAFQVVADTYYHPLSNHIGSLVESRKRACKLNSELMVAPMAIGINGAQGTGKSTLADFIADRLESQNLQAAVLSIDDFYLTKLVRKSLAEEVHPLLVTRGVPGTHDLPLAFEVLTSLAAGKHGVALPRFDKSIDDRAPESEWPVTDSDRPVDLIILEGWCVGSTPENSSELQHPINELERNEDMGGDWRTYVNQCLAGDYQRLYTMLDYLIMLKAPDFDSVYRWRLEQEQKLVDKVGADAEGIMNEEQIARFIQHYERLTRHNLAQLSSSAAVTIELNELHEVILMKF